MKILCHRIILIYLLIICYLPIMAANGNCNYYPNSHIQCISNTSIFKCQYNIQQGKCFETFQQNLGCSQYLNKEACINQLTNIEGENIYCAFFQTCQTIDLAEVQKLGCFDRVNKLACMNVEKQKCFWNNKCEQVKEDTIKTAQLCDQLNLPVTPYTCQQIQSGLCMNNGHKGDFRCVEVRLDQLSTLSCNELGLNDKACQSITTDDQHCIFQDDQCKQIQPDQVVKCNQKLNKNACISTMKLNGHQLLCEWIDQSCRVFQGKDFKCQTKNEVNASVCQQSQSFCMYDEKQKKCKNVEINEFNLLGCNAPGLSKKACLKIKSQNCSFFKGSCQELNYEDLNFYQCNMDLNEAACVNLKNNSQFCLWNGNNCEAIFINQNTNCPLEMKKSSMKVNGNVCQAISKPNVICKYDINNNLCIQSSVNDQCSTPFLNQLGCLSIQKTQQTCQWTNKGCTLIKVEYQLTKCEDIGLANPISCSQVYEDDSKGCYFDKINRQCQSIKIKDEKELLNKIKCNNLSEGLNKVICGSITTESTPCRWFQEQCVYISKRSDIADVPCLHLQYSNYLACALVSFQNELCMYSEKLIGCIDNFQENNKNCGTLGLNSIGCEYISKISNSLEKCYFYQNKCIKSNLIENQIEDEIQIEDEKLIDMGYNNIQKCALKSLQKLECASIITQGQLCEWSLQKNSCTEISVEYNTKCIKYSGKNVIINPNVCASILTDQSDYCAYDKETTNCKIFSEGCTTNCCTEVELIGINAHSCSKFSSQEIDVYCYFNDLDLRCTELTTDILDTSNEELVKYYFNQLQLPCTSMNFNSCHMINWSKSQRCYYDGYTCTNLNVSLIKDLKILTSETSRLNEYACLAIEAKTTALNTLKYFGYDSDKKICKTLLINQDFESCDIEKGNKNVCTRYTGEKYCIWDFEELQCVEIMNEELGELTTCNSNLNRKACIENVSVSDVSNIPKNPLPCFFSYFTDICQEAPQQIQCEYFNGKGEISKSVCERINLEGQLCEYSEKDKTCIRSETKFDNCDISKMYANNRVCFSSTNGNCRWDSTFNKCYKNQTDIAELNCTDNLSKILCLQVTKQACMWDNLKFQCQEFKPKTSKEFEDLNKNVGYFYNEKACLLITEAGYYYDTKTNKCIKIDESMNNLECDQYQMNQYACLYQTRTHLCFYDKNEQPPNKLCKLFEDEQSQCNTSYLINIEVCMNLPIACIFDESTLQCTSFEVKETMTCTYLFNESKNKKHHNKISCASVSSSLTQVFGEKQCSEEKENFQQCRFEKYCYWKEYTCQVYKLSINYFDTKRSQNQESIKCPDTVNEEKGCQQDLSFYNSDKFIPQELKIYKIVTNWINETCLNSTHFYMRKYIYNQIEDQSQNCEITICSKSEQIICTNDITKFNIINKIDNKKEQRDVQLKINEIHHTITFDDDTIQKVCPKQFNYPYDQFPYDEFPSNTCQRQEYYILNPWCQLLNNEIRTCDKSFSKALCLELNQESCFFDINQGGCLQLINNEHKIPNCESLSNNCFASQSKNAICQNGVVLKKPGNSCLSIQKDQQTCQRVGNQFYSLSCNESLNQPVLCASANDHCYFDGTKCLNTKPVPFKCNKSFSKSLCEDFGCDYTSLGYCQEKNDLKYPKLNDDCSNKYYQCYEVNQLFISDFDKKKICGLVDQACKFTDKCVDATHSTCNELDKLVVSQQACVRCTDQAMKYDNIKQVCNPIAEDISQCENLNKQACLSFSKDQKCQWQKSESKKCNQKKYEFACKTIENIKITDLLDCLSLNQLACNQEQQNLCWFNPLNKLCEKYNPLKGKCEQYMNKQTCNLSMVESCIWNGLICKKYPLQQSLYCEGLNKYGCLNAYKPCVWFDDFKKCEQAKFLDQSNLSDEDVSCNEILQNQSDYQYMNAQTCTQINVNKSCILGKNYKCREIIEPQLYECEQQGINTLGLNKYACLYKTKNSCAFKDNKCYLMLNVKQGCQHYLNEVACLNQDDNCQFNELACQNYDENCKINQLACQNYNENCKFTKRLCSSLTFNSSTGLNKYAPYSKSTCYVFDHEKIGLIYSPIQKRCLQVEQLNRKLKDCNEVGVNKYACLNQVENYCSYYEKQCKYINPSSIKECSNTLNQYACNQVPNLKCKFKDQCNPFIKGDNCQVIAKDLYKVNKQICLLDKEMQCSYNSTTKSCGIIDKTKPQSSCKDLNLQACIFSTFNTEDPQNLLCEFDENEKQCQTSYGYSNCTDKVNKNKCLAIITKGQYCKFDENNGCQVIDTDIQTCETIDYQTNPITCSQSTDKPCFYDKTTKKCIEYKGYNSANNDISYLNYGISNIYSLNKIACEQFTLAVYRQDSQKITKEIFLQWTEGGCKEIKGIQQLGRLNCNQILNRNLCVNIRKPFQYCYYDNEIKQCIKADLKSYTNRNCTSIKNINSGAFCAQTIDVACFYDSQNSECSDIISDKIECEKDPYLKGYNKLACDKGKDNNCIFNEQNGQCFRESKSYIQFCKDAKVVTDCHLVMLEGCTIINNQCANIKISDYQVIKCEEAKNQIGCTNIQTDGQFCQYDQGKCINQNLKMMKNKICQDLKYVNSQEFCQQPKDKGCTYDFTEKSCKEVVSDFEKQLTCSKGINRIACLQLTNKDLKCSYLDYCFGPNQIDNDCDKDNEKCKIANSVETCLNQSQCKCQWQENQCKAYQTNSTKCDEIEYSSVAVCNSFKDCILDTKDFKCKSIQTPSCDQLQSPSQCSNIVTLPCIWNQEEQICTYFEGQDQMNCQDISQQNGSQRACMNIKKQGQMCIFKDNKCITFEQEQGQNNCLDNININSCLQQKISNCYWNRELIQVKKAFEDENLSYEMYGNCIIFDKLDKYDKQKFQDCDNGLSYTSCLNIIKEGVFCRWYFQQCSIIDDNGLIIYRSSDLTEVNSNACGLVNNGDIVKYDKILKLCIKVDDIQSLSCLTEGLNKKACLNIKFQNCLWDSTRRKCRLSKLFRQSNQNTCKLQNLSSYLCSQIKLDQPCGFMKDGCDLIDVDQVKCTYEGLNQYACLNIKKYPCIWQKNINDENYHCEDYLSYLPCDQIPQNVNAKVCSIVREQACYYNEQSFKCEIPNKDQNSCELTGLNIIGCVKIDKCFFDQKCQLLNKQIYKCKEFPIANKLICKNAQDSCKYNELQYGCSPAQNEQCSNDSLSDQGCLNQPNCILSKQGCQCQKFADTYDCSQIQDMNKCELQSHCILQYQNYYECKLRKCQDYTSDECDGKSILRSICYWSNSNECLSAQKCEEIIHSQYLCSMYKFNDRPCQKNKDSEICEQFNCENFSQEKCQEYRQFCSYIDQTCQNKQCNEYQIDDDCIKNKCEWNSKENTCQEQIDCSKIQERSQCNNQKYNSKSCQWVVKNDRQFCSEFRCNSLQELQQCSGSNVLSQFCVELNDSLCVSCEEISDSCDCLQQSQYCNYDIKKDKCTSKNCESYLTEQECPKSYCTFIEQKCQIQCEFRYNIEQCKEMNQCKWIEEYQKCQIECEYFKDEELCHQFQQCKWIEENQKCQIECEYFKDEELCQQIQQCKWIKENQKCQIQCEYFKVDHQCKQMDQCEWIDNSNKCQINCQYFQDEELCKQNQCSWNQGEQQCIRIIDNLNIKGGAIITGLIILCLILI